jgi:hypothetical protein
MAARRAWVLNLDADVELAAIASGAPAYTPSARVLEAMRPHAERLARELADLEGNDMLVDDRTPPGAARGLEGRAFCPTPRARALLARAGATAPAGPPPVVLVRVNGRAFAHELGPGLPGAAFVTTEAEAEAKLATPPSPGVASRWRIKRAYGMAGRGQRVVTPGKLAEVDRALVRGGVAEGGVLIEPDVEVVQELGLHGLLAPDGTLALGALVVQMCDTRGQWLRTARATEDDPAHAQGHILRAEASRVARALAEAGYAGPFGIDAFVWRDRRGETRLQPLSEINARYSMGWPTGFDDR